MDRLAWQSVAEATIGELAVGLGVDGSSARVLQRRNRYVVHLPHAQLVVRAQPIRVAGSASSAERELQVVNALAAAGCAVAPPARSLDPGPYVRNGLEVTLWSYVAPSEDREPSPDVVGEALRDLHTCLSGVDAVLPSFTWAMDDALRLLQDARTKLPELGERDVALLRRLLQGSMSGLPAVVDTQALHGEPSAHNLHPTATGPVWLDFESTCRGPVEWDVAALPVEALGRYGSFDVDLERPLRRIRLLVTTTHCWHGTDRDPDAVWAGNLFLPMVRALE